ncbi:MAG TPA: CxxC-x17-CxxC domain-containing protein, partial [Candidatus Nanoarchaeia archaeon]|nr:CxxC-x17-CxxC domain-containing protein [Candidatus Nanoarchaeia archaeon]
GNFGPREMHPAKCSECGKQCEVPFKPTEGKPVYCRECHAKRKPRF